MAKKTARNKAPDFEQAMEELETLVEKMEEGDISLEESLQYFEKGIALTRACQDALKNAEQKVQILLEKNTESATGDFHAEDE